VIRIHSDGRWPGEGFTAEQNRDLAARHQAGHDAGRAFAFVLEHPRRAGSVGCLYLNPLRAYLERSGADAPTLAAFGHRTAMVTFWIRQDLQHTALPGLVTGAASAWIASAWPVDAHLFRILPGERSSRAALERPGMRRLTLHLAGEHRPYLWFQPGLNTPETPPPAHRTRHPALTATATTTTSNQERSRENGSPIRH
jgi:hypothetical protein